MKKLLLFALIALTFASARAAALDAAEIAARERDRALCNAAMDEVAAGVAAQDRSIVQPAIDRLETLVHRSIVCGFAPAIIAAAYRLELAEPGEGEPDAEAHFRHQAARWWLQRWLDDAPPEEWDGFADIFGPAFREWPTPLRDALLNGVEGERAWAALIVKGGPLARLELMARLHFGIGQAPYPSFARTVSDPPTPEEMTPAEKRAVGQMLLSPAADPSYRAGGRYWLREAVAERDAIAALVLGGFQVHEGDYTDAYYHMLLAAALGAWPNPDDVERAAAALTAKERKKVRREVHLFLRYSTSAD
ncbi:MAG: hypothetical protein RIB45_08745 [Marivibrio sp.]|uniref:hypothetical protein n=1 Tax=Marivibrio sp. TaxID=2039719 RepID=UPI0032EFE95A